jgi:hypothetical protein
MAFIDLFIERNKQEKTKSEVTESSTRQPMINITTDTAVSNVVNSSLVEDFLGKFRKVLADENTRNFPGNDFFEFFQMKQAMTAPIPEDIKYQTVFAGWGASGKQSKDSLISTAKNYLSILDKDIKDVEVALKSQYDQTVGKAQELIKQKTEKTKELNDELNHLLAEIEVLKKGTIDQGAEIVSQKEAFSIASKQIREEILTEIDKITKYIQ